MATTVKSIPSVSRKTVYDYDSLFNGEIHRLVQGEDFKVSPASFRGALYGRKKDLNDKNPENQIGLTVQFRTEGDETVAYVQRTEPKVRKAAAKPAAKKAASPAKPATGKGKVTPNPKEARKPVTPTVKA